MVPTSSTINQLSIGDALAVASLNKKKISKKDFKKFHPSGKFGCKKLKTVEDLMLTKEKIPFINENSTMRVALKIITLKKLGTLIARNSKGTTTGIITDGQIRRVNQKYNNFHDQKVKKVMTKNPISVYKETLAMKALSIMNDNKITSLCVSSFTNKKKLLVSFIFIIYLKVLLTNHLMKKKYFCKYFFY